MSFPTSNDANVRRLRQLLESIVLALHKHADGRFERAARARETVDEVFPPYPPLKTVLASTDVVTDTAEAIALLNQLSAEARSPREVLRFALARDELRS